MKIRGKYEIDSNFTTVYADGRIYTIAGNGDWRSLGIGECAACGGILTQAAYDEMARECGKEATFELED